MVAVLTGLKDFLGLGPKARIYVRIQCHVYEGAYHLYIEECIRNRSLKGWMRVRHLPINSYLEMELEGSRFRLEKLLKDFQNGPASARVHTADVQWKTFQNLFKNFWLRS